MLKCLFRPIEQAYFTSSTNALYDFRMKHQSVSPCRFYFSFICSDKVNRSSNLQIEKMLKATI